MEVGDYVNVLPYNKFDDHIGIGKTSWEYMVETNPHKIQFINIVDEELEDSRFT